MSLKTIKSGYIRDSIIIDRDNVDIYGDSKIDTVLWTDRPIDIFKIVGVRRNISIRNLKIKYVGDLPGNPSGVKIGEEGERSGLVNGYFDFDFEGDERFMKSRLKLYEYNEQFTGRGANAFTADLSECGDGSWMHFVKIRGNWDWTSTGLKITRDMNKNQYVNTVETDLTMHASRTFAYLNNINMCDIRIKGQCDYVLETNYRGTQDNPYEEYPHTDDELNTPLCHIQAHRLIRDVLIFDQHRYKEQWKRAGKHLSKPISNITIPVYTGFEYLNLQK